MTSLTLKEKEFARVLKLAEYDIDYSRDFTSLEELSKLAAHIAGTPISFINLIGSNTQWSLAAFGMEQKQLSREESICQFTIYEEKFFEARNLDTHPEFKNREYVTGDPNLRYYLGVPIQTTDGHNIGTVCVMDQQQHQPDPEKVEMLNIIARNVIKILDQHLLEKEYRLKMEQLNERSRKISHDIRGPLGGIIGISQIIREQVEENNYEELGELSGMIHQSGTSMLEFTEEILNEYREARNDHHVVSERTTLSELCQKIESLYQPQATHKDIDFSARKGNPAPPLSFPKSKLLQVIGNLVSNAIKFTHHGGYVRVLLSLEQKNDTGILKIHIADNGIGMDQDQIDRILKGSGIPQKSVGTNNERGFGFGFQVARTIIESMNGSLSIDSEKDKGTDIRVSLDVKTDSGS